MISAKKYLLGACLLTIPVMNCGMDLGIEEEDLPLLLRSTPEKTQSRCRYGTALAAASLTSVGMHVAGGFTGYAIDHGDGPVYGVVASVGLTVIAFIIAKCTTCGKRDVHDGASMGFFIGECLGALAFFYLLFNQVAGSV